MLHRRHHPADDGLGVPPLLDPTTPQMPRMKIVLKCLSAFAKNHECSKQSIPRTRTLAPLSGRVPSRDAEPRGDFRKGCRKVLLPRLYFPTRFLSRLLL